VTYSIRELNTHTRKPVYTRKYTAHEGFGEEIKNHFAIGKYKGIFFLLLDPQNTYQMRAELF
jgi:hypothetical protein